MDTASKRKGSDDAPKVDIKEFQELPYHKRLVSEFNPRFIAYLFFAYFGVKGVMFMMMGLLALPYYKNLGLGASSYQAYITVAMVPWSMKAVIGMLSDSIPIAGYHKRFWIAGSSVFGVVGICVIALMPENFKPMDPDKGVAMIAALMAVLVNVQISVTDLLCEGKYAEIMAAKPHTGSDLVTFVWMCIQAGSLLAACLVGPLVDYVRVRDLFWIALPFSVLILIPTLAGYLPEERLPEGCRGMNYTKIKAQPRVFLLGSMMALGGLLVAIVDMLKHDTALISVSISVSVLLIALSFYCLPPTLAKCNTYMFLSCALYINIQGAMDYFFTAKKNCLKEGPQFDYTYYYTWSKIIAVLAGLFGTMLFQACFSRGKFRFVFWFCTLLQIIAGIFDITLVNRWNIDIGISDKAFFMFGDAMLSNLILALTYMPQIVLTAKLCPTGVEATMYALLAGFQNFGDTVSRSIGVVIIDMAGMHTTVTDGHECNFDSLSTLVIVCHMAVPLLLIPLTFLLIPDAYLTDDLFEKQEGLKVTEDISLADPDKQSLLVSDGSAAEPHGHAI